MDLKEQLIAFVDLATNVLVGPAVAKASKQMAVLGVCGGLREDGVAILSGRKLIGPFFRGRDGKPDPDAVLGFVNESLGTPGVHFVLVAFEGWMSPLAEKDDPVVERFAHLDIGPDGRAEVVICNIHTEDFQGMVLHGIRHRGRMRSIVRGPIDFKGLTMKGRFVRDMPVQH